MLHKNGIISNSINEPASNDLWGYPDYKYQPNTNNNSTWNGHKAYPLVGGQVYHVTLTVSWGGFETFADNFNVYFQGDRMMEDGSANWNDNRICNPMNNELNLKDAVKNSPSGGSHDFDFTFTCPEGVTGYTIGYRANYSDGKGWLGMSNVLVIPEKYYGTKIYKDEIIMDNFIEY